MNKDTELDLPLQMGPNFLGDLSRALAYHRWLIVLVALGSAVSAYVALQFMTEQYVSSSHLLVKLGRENLELPATVEKGGLFSTGVRKEEINSEIQLISSRPLIEATVDHIGLAAFKLEPPPPRTWFQRAKHALRQVVKVVRQQIKETLILLNLKPRLTEREEAVSLVQATLTVEREKDSDVITVSSQLPSGALAQQVVGTLGKLYLERRVDVRRDRGVSEFFDRQLSALREQLGTLDTSKQRVRQSRAISGVLEERGLLLGRLQALYAEVANDERELKLLAPRRGSGKVVSAPASGAVPTGSSAPASALSSFPNIEQLRSKVTELRLRRTDLQGKFNDGAEPLQRVDREVGQIENTLRQAIASQLAERRSVVTTIERRLASLNEGEIALEVIERDRAVLTQNYQSYAKRREEARATEALDLSRVSNIAVLAPADLPLEPVAPRKMLILGLSLPFGVLAGLALALLLEYLNPLIRDERDLSSAERKLFLGTLGKGGGPHG